MAVPPIPPPLEELTHRPFSFFPPILNIDHNEWIFRRASWSEMLVFNPKMQIEVWVPRRFIGEVSRIDEPVMIVGLRKELEYKAGSVWPHERRVLAMPRASHAAANPGETPSNENKAPVLGIRLESGAESRIGKLIGVTLVLGIVACFVVVSLFREAPGGGRIEYKSVLQSELGLTSQDDYHAIVRKLGQPAEDRWRSPEGERQYRALYYPNSKVTVILMGAERGTELYIGAKDQEWNTVHSVNLPGGASTASMLRSLKRF